MELQGVDRQLISELARNTVVHEHEKELVERCKERFKDKQLVHFDTETIRREKRGSTLRKEFVRLMQLKQQFYQELDRISASSTLLEEEIQGEKAQEEEDQKAMQTVAPESCLFNEIMHRAKMRAVNNVRYVYAKPRFMSLLEKECPVLMDERNRCFRQTLTKSLLLSEDPDPTIFMVQLELLEMIENGELTQEEATMRSSKLAFERDRLIERIGKLMRRTQPETRDEEVKGLFLKSNQELEQMLGDLGAADVHGGGDDSSLKENNNNKTRKAVNPELSYADYLKTLTTERRWD